MANIMEHILSYVANPLGHPYHIHYLTFCHLSVSNSSGKGLQTPGLFLLNTLAIPIRFFLLLEVVH